ncbi:MAG: TRAP transporter large permease subunit [Bilophila wadsworthia]
MAPLLLPLAKAIGLDPIQYAAIFGVNLAVGSLTPPYASLLYLGYGSARSISWKSFLCGAVPAGYVPVMLLTTYWPDVSLFIPACSVSSSRTRKQDLPDTAAGSPAGGRIKAARTARLQNPSPQESIMKKVMSVLALCGLLALSGGSAFAAQWKLAHIRPADSVIERDLQAFAKEVREATDGRIDIRIYGSSQLGDYTVVQEKVSLGSVEMSCESVSTQVDKRFLSYILPYVAKDYATAKKNFGTGTPYAKYCDNLFDKQDIMSANWPVYFGGIGLVKARKRPPIPTPATIKVRVPTMKTQEALADGLGYQATPAVRGILHRRPDRHGLRHFRRRRGKLLRLLPDLLKCYIAANTHFENWPLLINKELFESLSAEDQKILLEKSAAFEARRWEVAEADQAAYEKKLEEAGWTVIRLTPEQQNAFAEKGRKASWPELKKAIGDKAYEEVISTFVLE